MIEHACWQADNTASSEIDNHNDNDLFCTVTYNASVPNNSVLYKWLESKQLTY